MQKMDWNGALIMQSESMSRSVPFLVHPWLEISSRPPICMLKLNPHPYSQKLCPHLLAYGIPLLTTLFLSFVKVKQQCNIISKRDAAS